MIELREHYQEILDSLGEAAKIAGREPSDITLMAVSKTRTYQEMLDLYSCGQLLFGENRVQEVQEKVPLARPDRMRLHLIGEPSPVLPVHGFPQRGAETAPDRTPAVQ